MSLTLPNGTRFRITSCIFAILAGTTVNSPYLSLIMSEAPPGGFELHVVLLVWDFNVFGTCTAEH